MKKWLWLIVILSLFTATFFNQLNLNQLPKEFIRDGETVVTNDDLSYIRPAIHFNKTGVWKDEIKGDLSYFLRSPGYGTLYYISLLIKPTNPLLVLKVIQVLLFSTSVYCLYFIALFFLNQPKFAFTTTIIYGLTPIASNFLFYTLTEGITPALLIFYIFFLVKSIQQTHVKQKLLYLILATLIFAFLFITRPVLGIFIGLIPLAVSLNFTTIQQKIGYGIIFTVLAYSFMGVWQYRNYKITNQYIGLHPIYYADNNSIYRPQFKAFWDFTLGWAEDGATVHNYMLPFWQKTIEGDTSKIYINQIINQFPATVQAHFGKDRLTEVLVNYQKTILYQKQFYDKGLTMPLTEIEIETITVKQLQQLVSEFKKEFWFTYYIKSPIKVYAKMALHSNLSLNIFQVKYRGQFLMETMRWFSFLIHSFSFISILLIFYFFKKINHFVLSIYISTIIYLFYLCYFQRGIEERYTLPVLPILLASLVHFISLFNEFLNRKFVFIKSTITA